ncbi:MAG TPA: succinylglutamate desuccinylase [Devosia sp.]|nr:succinylglutamate desuccinylase [Devosia sp.]
MPHTEIDFDRPGKQVGFIDFPHSVHTDAWGVLPVPLCVIKNGAGPTVLLQGGNHGDEYEGPIILGELVRDLDPARVTGRLIIVPAINRPAIEAGNRCSPLDGLNFNRTFPGNPTGSITEQLSSYVHDVLFPLADMFVDLHSGGSSLDMIPSAIMEPCNDPGLAQKIRAAVVAFGAPINVVISNYGDPRTSTAAAVRAGLVTVGTELGGAGAISPEALKIGRNGLYNLLAHFGVVAGAKPDRQGVPLPVHDITGAGAYVRANQTGVFEPFHRLGDKVSAGQGAGRIHFLSNPDKTPVELVYEKAGVVYGMRQPGIVRPGNCCVVVASPSEV